MVRVKRGIQAHKRRKNVLKEAKGFKWGRSTKYKAAKEALMHAWSYSYRDRRNKKRDFRRLWQLKINAASRAEGITYSRFINGLKTKKIAIDRKILSTMVEKHPNLFKAIVEEVKK